MSVEAASSENNPADTAVPVNVALVIDVADPVVVKVFATLPAYTGDVVPTLVPIGIAIVPVAVTAGDSYTHRLIDVVDGCGVLPYEVLGSANIGKMFVVP